VRLHYGRYELVAGERRLRAAKLAGLKTVPCTVIDVDMEGSSLLAMVENIQREDLDFIEEALGIANLIRLFDMSQDEIAKKLGKSQSAVANKLRLLKLPKDVLFSLRENGLTER
ncbi:MAG TPA: nucleoid occlusion protein, partial [Clostridiales bacterium]|nr:nucleoid occlusion protein [Clostridiales bacterium]